MRKRRASVPYVFSLFERSSVESEAKQRVGVVVIISFTYAFVTNSQNF